MALRRFRDKDMASEQVEVPVMATTAPVRELNKVQREELRLLLSWKGRMQIQLHEHDRARAYLQARGVGCDGHDLLGRSPLYGFDEIDIGYIPADAKINGHLDGIMGRWRDRIVFWVKSTQGVGCIGYSLSGWEPGMGPTEHEFRFDATAKQSLWEFAGVDGWFNVQDLEVSVDLIAVRDVWDALTFQRAGLLDGQTVIAYHATSLYSDWVPAHIQTLTIADAQVVGYTDAFLRDRPMHITRVMVPDDDMGTSWNARWLARQHEGLLPALMYPEHDTEQHATCQAVGVHIREYIFEREQRRWRCPLCCP